MTSHHLSEHDSATIDSVTSSPRSDYPPHQRLHDELQPRVRFMCSFGGKILPRPHDNLLRYVGGDTRIVAVHRGTTFSALLMKLSKLSGTTNVTVKYQLPNEDLDALISVTTDEDVENMMDEYDRLTQNLNSKTARLRLFLFQAGDDSRASSISSLLGGSTKRENWFFDAINGGAGSTSGLERGRSEASSIVSEVPDYLFGLDNSDEARDPKFKLRPVLTDNVSVSDPGSPAPAISSPFCSTSSAHCVPSFPDLPPVKTKPETPIHLVEPKENVPDGFAEAGEPPVSQPSGYPGNTMWHYLPDSHYTGQPVQQMPIYYVPGPVPHGNVPVQHVPIRAQYVQQFSAGAGQIPVGFRQPVAGVGQMYGGGMRAVTALDPYEMSARVVPEGSNQQVYYGIRNAGVVTAYPGMVVPAGEELQGTGPEMKMGRLSQSS